MKKILLSFIVLFLLSVNLFSSYVLVNMDEGDTNNKFYGYQLDQSTAWKGLYVSSSTINYTMGTSTTTYSQWWAIHTDTTTVHYRDGFNYGKYVYPN